ncbi:ABC transporter permease [Legionella maioricensis]|uniref:ABC transporter permease n=1 Tax=Legionella maioricensis TaxID=2896528 RepID=A0A9X2ICB4_9GAMM|nr:ABC transporter permease [Legionella maioricensis]MCL9685265.1 ABC transporter permease [Legionella maioricensis]MCL9688482.1 ABC transporter permease [Legionella maioricensis]
MKRSNILQLGFKEFNSLIRDPIMVVLILFAFTVSVYSGAKALPEVLNKAPIAIVDEDQSALSQRITDSFYPPHFIKPVMITPADIDKGMDEGIYTFIVDIPPEFQKDLLAGRSPTIQLNVDATRLSQAFNGNSYIYTIINQEVNAFISRYRAAPFSSVDLAIRMRFNPALTKVWFGALMQIINEITMLSIVLTGAALIREREHGTIEHLLVMPVTPFEIMVSKIWSMALVVLLASIFSLLIVVQGILSVPIEGSLTLFFIGVSLNLFATTSMGIFMATVARSMPQFALLLILILLPMELLSGGFTPQESMPKAVRFIMMFTPTPHFVSLAQAILFRGAGFPVVWPQFTILILIGAAFFTITLRRFRKTIGMSL